MGRFDSVIDIKGRLRDFEIQCVTDWWGDPVRNMLDITIEQDVFESYKKSEYYHSLIRLETYISIVILKMLLQKCPRKIVSPLKRRSGLGWLVDLEPIIKKLHRGLKAHLRWFKECFKEEIPNQLVQDLHIIRELRNAYAHRLTPVQVIFTDDEHGKVLQAMRNTWQDLRKEYCRVVPE